MLKSFVKELWGKLVYKTGIVQERKVEESRYEGRFVLTIERLTRWLE